MSLLGRWIFMAVWVLNVQAKDEMLVHGWVPEPHGRGTYSILWSCLATIFLCTWSALHLDIPKRHGRWFLLFRKVSWMLVALIMPEYIVAKSAITFLTGRNLFKYLAEHEYSGWTLTYAQFAVAGGFWINSPQGGKLKCSVQELYRLIENGEIDGLPISEEELKSSGRSDWVVKFIAVVQIGWFGLQTLFRAIQHYHITALEIITLAFIFCSIFTYGFCFKQPQGVEYPVQLRTRDTAHISDDGLLNPGSDGSKRARAEAESALPTSGIQKTCSYVLIEIGTPVASDLITNTLLLFFGCGFGAIHCLAWNSSFPTSEERLAWRICSVGITALPIIMVSLVISLSIWYNHQLSDSTGWVFMPLVCVYAVGRITILVLAFMALRALPADAFQTVDWTDYFPRFGA